ncbi:hypothetical protein [Deinococcus ruber]|nr:hypothetical protein [Deinococcus ruber]
MLCSGADLIGVQVGMLTTHRVVTLGHSITGTVYSATCMAFWGRVPSISG